MLKIVFNTIITYCRGHRMYIYYHVRLTENNMRNNFSNAWFIKTKLIN